MLRSLFFFFFVSDIGILYFVPLEFWLIFSLPVNFLCNFYFNYVFICEKIQLYFFPVFLLRYFFSTMHIINKIKNISIIIIIMSCGFVEMKIFSGLGSIFLAWWKCGIFWKVKLSNFFQHQNKKKNSYVGKVFFISNLKYFMYCGKLRENVENSVEK